MSAKMQERRFLTIEASSNGERSAVTEGQIMKAHGPDGLAVLRCRVSWSGSGNFEVEELPGRLSYSGLAPNHVTGKCDCCRLIRNEHDPDTSWCEHARQPRTSQLSKTTISLGIISNVEAVRQLQTSSRSHPIGAEGEASRTACIAPKYTSTVRAQKNCGRRSYRHRVIKSKSKLRDEPVQPMRDADMWFRDGQERTPRHDDGVISTSIPHPRPSASL